MEDYSINPEIVAKCDVEIQKHCNKGTEGKTIDCLMDLAEESEGKENEQQDIMRPQCFKAVSNEKRQAIKILFFL